MKVVFLLPCFSVVSVAKNQLPRCSPKVSAIGVCLQASFEGQLYENPRSAASWGHIYGAQTG
jgi:hypothetical protein